MRWIVCVFLFITLSERAWTLEPRLEPAVVTVALDEYFYLQVHIGDAEGADCQIEFPSQKEFEIVKAGISQSQSIQVIGQQVERSHTWIHNFRLRAKEAGDFTYGPARVTIAGHSYATGVSAIHVRPERFTPGRSGLMDFFSPDPFVRNDGRMAVHVETVFDKGTAWVGEGVVQYVDIYASRPRITGVQFAQISRDGFWEILPENYNQGRPLRVTRDGKEWYRYRYPVAWLFPLTSGEKVIPPFAVRVDYDQFWMRSQAFQTEPLRLMVLPLPAGAGKYFSGAVGNFDISARIEEPAGGFVKDTPFTLVLTVNGFGNIRSLEAPLFPDTPDFRIMPPQHTTQVQIKEGRVSGSQTYR
ncbi:MAG: BatD family protein, partial [Spirochaetota bacterium]|nr:BatD family protein [Spirochaetota bacterium]